MTLLLILIIVIAIGSLYFLSKPQVPKKKSLTKTVAKNTQKKPFPKKKVKTKTPTPTPPPAPKETSKEPEKEYNFEAFQHPDIQAFGKLLVAHNKKVSVAAQNEWVRFISEPLIFKTKFYYAPYIKEDCQKHTGNLIDPDSMNFLFHSDHIDGEGPCYLTDKSGKIYKYFFGFGDPKINLSFDSIWDVFDGKENLIEKLKGDDTVIRFDNLPTLADYIKIEEVIKFQIHVFYIQDYKTQLETLFATSDGALVLNDFTWKEFEWHSTELIDCSIEINGNKNDIQVEKSKWYSMKFPGTINQLLAKMEHPLRISLLHENGWDETHGLKLSSIEEHELLGSKNFIVK